jgi:hypothetical protein
VPPKGLLIRFHSTVRPTLPSCSVAPITAMLFGAKIARSASRSKCSTSSVRSATSPGLGVADFGLIFFSASLMLCS